MAALSARDFAPTLNAPAVESVNTVSNPYKSFTDEWGATITLVATVLSILLNAYTIYHVSKRGQ